MSRISLLAASLVPGGLSAPSAFAQVSVDHAWSRATPPRATSCLGLAAPLGAGASLPVHLQFQTAPPADVTAQIQPLGSPGLPKD